MMQMPFKSTKYFYQIDFLRFWFALTICYCHALFLLPQFYDTATYQLFYQSRLNTQIATDFFFVIAGFFLFYKMPQSLGTFIKKKFIRLMPAIYISWGFCFVLNMLNIQYDPLNQPNINLISLLPNIFMVDFFAGQSILGPTWFVNCLIWISLFYVLLYKTAATKNFFLLTSLIIFISFNIICTNGIFFNNIFWGFFKLGVIRALCAIGLGIFIYYAYQHAVSLIRNTFICSFLEIAAIAYLIKGLYVTDFLAYPALIIAFCCLFILFLVNKGILSRFFNHKAWHFFGRISYILFLIHIPVFFLTQAFIYLAGLPQSPWIFLLWLIVPTLAIAILVHFLFEQPLINLLNKKFIQGTVTP